MGFLHEHAYVKMSGIDNYSGQRQFCMLSKYFWTLFPCIKLESRLQCRLLKTPICCNMSWHVL